MKHTPKEKDLSLFNFAYLLVYLLILGCATVSIPFYAQKYHSEEIRLKRLKHQCQTAIEERNKEIYNLRMRTLACQSEAIKQHADSLKLQKPQSGQLVQFDKVLNPRIPAAYRQTAVAAVNDEKLNQNN